MKLKRVFDYMLATAWALESETMERMCAIVLPRIGVEYDAKMAAEDIKSASPKMANDSAAPQYTKQNGVAVIPINGVITKYAGVFDDVCGMTSCERIGNDLKAAMDDDEVDSIMLAIDSPGGAVQGVQELAASIRAARDTKKIVAFADGMMASAAYWLGSQANEIVTSSDAVVGSIGVYVVQVDSSRAVENAGYKVNVIKAGAYKGGGVSGTPITDAQKKETQRTVDSFYSMFVDAVAAGRSMSSDDAQSIGDGRVHVGSNAVAVKLADSVGTFKGTLERMASAGVKSKTMQSRGLHSTKGAQSMTVEEEAKAKSEAKADERARVASINAAFPKDPAFANKMIAEDKTVAESKAAYADVLQAKLDEQTAANAAQETAHKKALAEVQPTAKPRGNNPVGTENAAADKSDKGERPAKSAFMTKVDGYRAEGLGATEALQKAAAKFPDLHAAMLDEANGEGTTANYVAGARKTYDKRW